MYYGVHRYTPLCRMDIKYDLLKACRTVKRKNLYTNESLKPTLSCILYGIRLAKKSFHNRIAGIGSSDGKVFETTRFENNTVLET